MATELPAQGGGAPDDEASGDGYELLVGDANDLDAELGEDVALDEEETAA
jgi:hypothetical protein